MKIFIGNLPDEGMVKNEDIRPLFEQYGTVSECEVIKNYGWVQVLYLISKSSSPQHKLKIRLFLSTAGNIIQKAHYFNF